MKLLVATLILSSVLAGAAVAQTGSSVNSGVTANAGSMTGPNIDVVNGTAANGMPRSEMPGASMTVGAGGGYMLPGVAGTLPKPKILTPSPAGTTTGTTNGTVTTEPALAKPPSTGQ